MSGKGAFSNNTLTLNKNVGNISIPLDLSSSGVSGKMFQHIEGISNSGFIQELNDNEALNKTISIAISGSFSSFFSLIFYGRVTLLESSRVQFQGTGLHYSSNNSYSGALYQFSIRTASPYTTLYFLGRSYVDNVSSSGMDVSYILYDGITFDAS